ncbi:hypothetical protein [Desulfovermiculus halophilus]|uniref:hypothetical protein n=1 Tax=Desulfovermiculus halophilus TaxID=339722 RepID=UPI000484C8FD|nr:hypothetical protein [Desulfovermiculus halophilus]
MHKERGQAVGPQDVWVAFFANPALLQTYCRAKGRIPPWEAIQEDVLLHLRRQHSALPEHLISPWVDREFAKQRMSPGQYVRQVLVHMAQEYVAWEPGRGPYVRNTRLPMWQDLLTHFPPAVLLAVSAFQAQKSVDKQSVSVRNELTQAVQASTLPTVQDAFFDALVADKGVHDMHVHISGVPEADVVWQAALLNPGVVHAQVADKWRKRANRDLFRSQGIERPFEILRLLRLARYLRLRLQQAVACLQDKAGRAERAGDSFSERGICEEIHSILRTGRDPECTRSFGRRSGQHKGRPDAIVLLAEETGLWFDLLPWLEQSPRVLGFLAHFYLLVRCWFSRFLVLGRTSVGFSSFAQIAGSPLRELVEKDYALILRQLQGQGGLTSACCELRFAPKGSARDIARRVAEISRAWEMHHQAHKTARESSKSKGWQESAEPCPGLQLTAHLIKSDAEGKNSFCRHQAQRVRNLQTARAIVGARKISQQAYHTICRVDAAANEMDTLPEAFAPAFRLLRASGLNRFTYHVGEDFSHLLSGLRSIDEAVTFLELGSGDRLGHATALGMEPGLWRQRVGPQVACAQGEWLDDLIWLDCMLLDLPHDGDLERKLHDQIKVLYRRVYGRCAPDRDVLHHAWRMRKLDPFAEFSESPLASRWSRAEVALMHEKKRSPRAWQEFKKYHAPAFRQEYAKYCLVDTAWIADQTIKALQDALVRKIDERKMCIEAMPTSNLCISAYADYSEHHALRWLMDDTRPRPMFALGSDDPGVFHTSIRNEYLHLAQAGQENGYDTAAVYRRLGEVNRVGLRLGGQR